MTAIEKEPILADLPINHPTRSEADFSLQTFAHTDRIKDYTLNRNAPLYIRQFAGMRYFFEYLKSLRTNGLWLDVGTGTGLAAHQLSQDPITEGLRVMGTTLVKVSGQKYYLPEDKLLETSVEYLEGIENESISGVTGMASIAYSVVPEFAMRRLDQILVPGGALKATFNRKDLSSPLLRKHSQFSKELKRLGYNVGSGQIERWDVLVAIKPGNLQAPTARMLLERDRRTSFQQETDMGSEYDWILDSPDQ